jgi:hypothetical protein
MWETLWDTHDNRQHFDANPEPDLDRHHYVNIKSLSGFDHYTAFFHRLQSDKPLTHLNMQI